MAELPSYVVKTRELLNLRGYRVEELNEYEDRYEMIPDRQLGEYTIRMLVWIFKEQKVIGVAYVKDLVRDMEEYEAFQGMIVGGSRFTPAAKKHARANRVELVEGNYASFDLFDHQLVPKHTVASTEEVDLVLEHYGIDKPQLPRILRDDPAVRVLGARPGQVVRIERESPTAGRTYYYRLVVDAAR